MDYEELNTQIKEVRNQIRDIENDIRNTERSISEANAYMDRVRRNQEAKIQEKRELALNQKIREVSRPFELEISKLKDKKDKLREVLDKNTQKYTFDECAKKYSEEYTLVNQAKDTLSDVEDLGVDLLGENFSKQLYDSMNSVHIQPEDLNKIIVGLKRYKKNIKVMQKKSQNPVIKNYMDLILMKTNPYRGGDAIDTGALALYACCCIVLLFVVVLFGSWIYLVFLLVLATLNLSRNYFIYKMLYYTKILSDNTEDIAASLNQKVDADMSRILGDLNNAYNSRANALESQISAQQVKMRSAADNCLSLIHI